MPCGHLAYSVLIAWTPSIWSGNEVMSVIPIRRWSAGDASSSRKTIGADGERHGPAHDPADEARPQAAPLLALPTEERDPAAVDAVTQDRERRRQEGQAPDDRDEHHADRADRHRPEDRHVDDEQPGERDHHGEAAEEHGAAGGRARDLDGVELVAAPSPLGAEARDHEQRVVDRDREPDQDDQLRRVRADRARRSG